jgi:hypothetical protein
MLRQMTSPHKEDAAPGGSAPAVRPFRVDVPREALDELRRRLAGAAGRHRDGRPRSTGDAGRSASHETGRREV